MQLFSLFWVYLRVSHPVEHWSLALTVYFLIDAKKKMSVASSYLFSVMWRFRLCFQTFPVTETESNQAAPQKGLQFATVILVKLLNSVNCERSNALDLVQKKKWNYADLRVSSQSIFMYKRYQIIVYVFKKLFLKSKKRLFSLVP